MFGLKRGVSGTAGDPGGKTVIGRGFRFQEDPSRRTRYQLPGEIAISDADRKGHFFCFGTTRVGKTRIIENMVCQDLRKGYSAVVIDPKGDIELFSKIVQVASETGRLGELMFISSVFPEYSMTIDPLAHHYMPEELVAHIISGVQVGREPFFYNVSYEISIAIVEALLMADVRQKRKPFNLTDVKNYTSRQALENLSRRIADIDTPGARQLHADMRKIVDSPQDYYGKVSSSLRVALMELTSGNIGRIVGQGNQNHFIERLERGERVILVVHLGSLMTRKAAYTLGKVVISMIQSLVGRIFSSGRRVTPPLAVYMDESQSLLYPAIDELFSKSGGANVWVHSFAQSISQLYNAVGENYARAILDNTNTKVWMRVPDYETAVYANRHFGTRKGYAGVIGAEGGVTMREDEEDRVRPEDVLLLGEREFFLLTYSGMYTGRTSDVEPATLRVRFPDVRATQLEGG